MTGPFGPEAGALLPAPSSLPVRSAGADGERAFRVFCASLPLREAPSGPRQGQVISSVTVFGGRDRHRSGDLTLFRRALYQLSYPTVWLRRLPGAAVPTQQRF